MLNQPDEELNRKVEREWAPDGLTAHPAVLAASPVVSQVKIMEHSLVVTGVGLCIP